MVHRGGRQSPSLFPYPDHVSAVVAAHFAAHASTKCDDRLRRAEPTRQAVPIEVAFSTAAFAVAEKLIPLRQIGEGDFFRSSGWLRIASRYNREGGASEGIGSLYFNWQRSLKLFFVFEQPLA
ncbi:hypothetical protein ASD02_00690 [Ensifer sp. Root1252]|nr:hypothetical protein ASD02_00690 [Ensifer sp. Root1252]KRC83504.1 hypothetical protein ASE32_00685 [Ensifer sp. Root231]KRC86590.1 hypothetical protein ASE47_16965 [Ensifer sp. Root258]